MRRDVRPVSDSARRRPGVRATAVLGSEWVDEVRGTIPTVPEQIEAGLAEIRRRGFNEVLCMAIAHNITILVRQMFEVGILPDFLHPPEALRSATDGSSQAVAALPPSLNQKGAAPVVTLSTFRQ